MDSKTATRDQGHLDQKKNPYKLSKAASNEDASISSAEAEADLSPNLNAKVKLQYEKALET
jgi:hypothetical protein